MTIVTIVAAEQPPGRSRMCGPFSNLLRDLTPVIEVRMDEFSGALGVRKSRHFSADRFRPRRRHRHVRVSDALPFSGPVGGWQISTGGSMCDTPEEIAHAFGGIRS